MTFPQATTLLRRAVLWLGGVSVPAAGLFAAEVAKEDTAFFDEKIHPILKDRCYECHSHEAGKTKGGLALDSRSGWSEGGGSGPAVVPGKPEESLLIKAIRRIDDDLAMPPKKPLSEPEVLLLTDWVKRGAPDSRVRVSKVPDNNWWSLKPLPAAKAEAEGIDGFVARKLKENGMTMSPEADRRTLLRRVYFDLHGLAPTPEEMAAFIAEADPKAYEKVVDRLLASPRYGERWARHWFDTIHFADTHGFEHDEIRENAWRYRDYVIAALNADTSWPRFIREQLAADVFFPNERRLTPALGFLGAGPFDLSAAETAPKMFELVDRDDLVVQTMAAFTSTTVGCARCHDHKFDPIAQADYYALAAVFAGVAKGDLAYEEDEKLGAARKRWEELAAAVAREDQGVLFSAEGKQWVAEWEKTRGVTASWEVAQLGEYISAGGAPLTVLEDGSVLSGGARPDKETQTFTLKPKIRTITALRLEVLSHPSLPKWGPGRQDNGNLHLNECEVFVVDGAGGEARRLRIARASADFNQDGWTIAHAIDGNAKTAWGIFPKVGEAHMAIFELAEPVKAMEGTSIRVVLKQVHGGGHVIGRVRLAVTDAPAGQVALLPAAVADVLPIAAEQRNEAQRLALAAHVLSEKAAQELAKLPPKPMVYTAAKAVARKEKKVAMDEPRVIHVLSRGELSKPGEVANPGALACIGVLKPRFELRDAQDEAKRRAALADWIASAENPLTWRSVVNRVWHHHFGRGLVDTPNDFGRMGSLPSHPELLDWLAADFRDHGASQKRLHRMIVMSATYRQASAARVDANGNVIDGENRLLGRANRQRLDAESFRDIVLQTTGRLDLTMGGPPVMHFKLGPPVQNTPTLDYTAFDWNQPGANRRSIYRLVFRNIADPFMVALDFPDAAQLAPTRPFSASALQALALWNDDFVLHQSQRMTERLESMAGDVRGRLQAAARLVLLRDASAEELRDYLGYAEKHGLPALCRLLFNSNEFLFVN